ncbi:MAG: dephospho-CoA kinase [Pseudoxanthomonas sp.]
MSDYLIGLTGGVASGKSALETAFAARGIVVVDADRIARAVVEPGQPALAAIVAHFGKAILAADGRLDRAALRRIVFADPAQRQALEAITHPPIRQGLHEQCRAAASAYAVAMIPLLAEAGGRAGYPWLGRICVVTAPLDERLRRLQARDGIDPALARRMVEAQAGDAERLAIADDVVRNDATLQHLDRAVAGLHALYLRLAAAAA